MRWNKDAVLISYQDGIQNDEGVWTNETEVQRNVFCNARRLGSKTWGDAALAGYRIESEIELRSVDYCDEQEVILDGRKLQVIKSSFNGEFILLTLGERINNE